MKTRDVKRRLRSLLGIVCLCVVFGGGVVVYANSAPTPPSGLYALPKPAVMPSFNLPTTNGDPLDSTALAGQVVIVRFWATWWSTCRREMPSVQRVHDASQDRDVVILAISIDGGGLPTVKRFMEKKGYSMLALVDKDMETARAFGARGVPSTFVVNRQGMVVARGGALDVDAPNVKAYIDGLLKASQS